MRRIVRLWCFLTVLVLCAAACAEDWPNWRGPTHDGISVEKGWSTTWGADGPRVLWRASVGQGHASFAVAKGRVYTMGNARNTDTVFCFDAATGRQVWKKSYPCAAGNYPGPRSTPAVDGDLVFTLSREGHLLCFNAATGKPRWNRKLNARIPNWGLASSPLILGTRVIVNVGTSGMAFTKTSGRPSWSGGNGASGYASPVPMKSGSRTTLLMFGESSLYGVSTSGRRGWGFPWQTRHNVNAADPVVCEKRIFVSSGYGTGCAMLSVGRGRPRAVWRNRNMKSHFASPVYWKGYLYGFDDSSLQCLSAKTGRAMWSERSPGKGGLMLADGKLIIQAERGGGLIIAETNPNRFTELARARLPLGHSWTAPVLANGRIFCRDDRGSVVCVDVSGK